MLLMDQDRYNYTSPIYDRKAYIKALIKKYIRGVTHKAEDKPKRPRAKQKVYTQEQIEAALLDVVNTTDTYAVIAERHGLNKKSLEVMARHEGIRRSHPIGKSKRNNAPKDLV